MRRSLRSRQPSRTRRRTTRQNQKQTEESVNLSRVRLSMSISHINRGEPLRPIIFPFISPLILSPPKSSARLVVYFIEKIFRSSLCPLLPPFSCFLYTFLIYKPIKKWSRRKEEWSIHKPKWVSKSKTDTFIDRLARANRWNRMKKKIVLCLFDIEEVFLLRTEQISSSRVGAECRFIDFNCGNWRCGERVV